MSKRPSRKLILRILFLAILPLVLSLHGAWVQASDQAASPPRLSVQQPVVQPGDKIVMDFSGIASPGNKDWIAIFQVGAPNQKYGEWYYLNGQDRGTLTFLAPKEEGEYEFRLFLNWPAGGYQDVARSLAVKISKTQQPPAPSEATLKLDKNSFAPGAEAKVYFTAPSTYVDKAWIGIIPSQVAHGSEEVNDQYDLTYQYLGKRTSGTLTFLVPSQPGSYDFRMNDDDNNGREVASITFSVAAGGGPARKGIWIEAEEEMESYIMPVSERPAPNTKEVNPPYRPPYFGSGCWYLAVGGESLKYQFSVPQEGTHFVWVRDYVDRFQPKGVRKIIVEFDGRTYGIFPEVDLPAPGDKGIFGWHRIGGGVRLTPGEHILKVTKAATTSGAAVLDAYYLTSDPNEVPPEK